jgi:hypothetical protein
MSEDKKIRPTQPLQVQIDVKVPMRDGVNLSTDIYSPNGPGPFPTLLIRTIYDNQQDTYLNWTVEFVRSGYAVVMQDCRGRFDSDGAWEPYVHEADDGYDTQQWIGAQPWCDGNIGAFGVSYVGFTQTQPALQRSPYVKGIVPIASQQDNYGHIYKDGALALHATMFFANISARTMQGNGLALFDQIALYKRLPLISALDDVVDNQYYRDVIAHYTFDDFWKSYSLRDRYGEVETPAYFITGWYDALLHEGFRQYRGWSTQARTPEARKLTRLMVGPWTHYGFSSPDTVYGAVGFGQAGKVDFVKEQLRWFDQRLRKIDTGIDDEAPIQIFVMGENVWRGEHEWPLARTEFTPFYLHSGGRANSLYGGGGLSATAPAAEEPSDRYSYNPDDPVTTLGGPVMHREYTGTHDRRPAERRDDVLVYTTEPLAEDLEVTGPVTLTLYAASSARDTDFAATLVDVHPDGKAINICEGLRRARFRDSNESPALIEPGEVYEYTIDMWETSNVFKAGHRIRVDLTSSNFPRFDRNPNTGNRPGMDAEMQVADQTIFHDARRPSHINLPVIPRD